MTEESSTRITMKELYLQVQKIQSMLEKLTAQFPTISDQLDELEKDVNVRLNDHETRLRRIEMRMWQLFGAIGVASFVLPYVITLFG